MAKAAVKPNTARIEGRSNVRINVQGQSLPVLMDRQFDLHLGQNKDALRQVVDLLEHARAGHIKIIDCPAPLLKGAKSYLSANTIQGDAPQALELAKRTAKAADEG